MTSGGTECTSFTPLLMNSGVSLKQLMMTTDMAEFQDVSDAFFLSVLGVGKCVFKYFVLFFVF